MNLDARTAGAFDAELAANDTALLCGRPIGEILRHTAGLSEAKIAEALAKQDESGSRLGEVLVGMKAVTEEQVLQALALQLDLPFLEKIDDNKVDTELVQRIPINFAKQYKMMPLWRADGEIVVAVADPVDTTALDQARLTLQARVSPVVATQQVVIDAIHTVFERLAHDADAMGSQLDEEENETLAQEVEEAPDLIDSGDDEAPIIRLVNWLMKRAVKERASDIHIEPFEKELLVRFRVDGVLKEVIKPPKRFQKAITSRIKIMGQLNIAETRLPQDGRIRIKIAGKEVDIRLSTIPTAWGESCVMRLLDRSSVMLDLKDIGFEQEQYEIIDQLLHRSHGIVLVTGPTGSGKTTTLYAGLHKINKPDLKILTAEDPVEYQMKGVNQVAVQPKIGLTFAGALRSFLRQDPDVILVGEIRDIETAEIAIQASLTGHLVLSTVHTNDAPGAITRLVDMGVEPFLVASSLVGSLAQRLVRTLCKHCKEPYQPSKEELEEVGITPEIMERTGTGVLMRPKGCQECNNLGYKGRTGIYEMMLVDDEIRQMILRNVDSNTIKKHALGKGMMALREHGAVKVARGITSAAEVLRVVQDDVVL
ncbi:type II secretion system ATPase GspE [Vulgatibacter sp.]|uniref:type II secretion system ATPase GspE n=1 Tax=Vulgatibacter sp. TaxID=1971226 RepID=UPI003566A92F